jgi:hypothetical protein
LEGSLPAGGEGDGIGGEELPGLNTVVVDIKGAGSDIEAIQGGAGHKANSGIDHGKRY